MAGFNNSMLYSSIAAFMLTVVVAQKFAAADPVCHVHVEHGKCTYNVQIQQQPPGECDCEQWNNATDFVLANCAGKNDRWILNNTNTSLLTSECFKTIIYKLSCKTKYFTVNCTANCTQTQFQASENTKTEGHRHRFFVLLACVVLVLLLVPFVAFLYYRRKKEEPPAEECKL